MTEILGIAIIFVGLVFGGKALLQFLFALGLFLGLCAFLIVLLGALDAWLRKVGL